MDSSTADLQQLFRLVRRIEDRQQLAELLSRYGTAVDDRDFDTIGSLFAPDAQFHGVNGRQQIVDFIRARSSTFSTSSHHALTCHFDFLPGERASGVVNAHAELCIGGKTVRLALRYLDLYARFDQRWVFQQRVLKFRYVLPFDAVADGLDDPWRVRWPGLPAQLADLPDKLQTYIDSRKLPVAAALPPGH